MRHLPSGPSPFFVVLALLAGCGDSASPEGFPIEPPEPYERDLLVVDAAAQAAERDLAQTWLAGIVGGDDRRASEALAAGFRGRFPTLAERRAVPDPRVDVHVLEQDADALALDADGLLAALFAYVADWSHFGRNELEADRFWLAPDGKHATARAALHLAGGHTSARAELRATLELALVHETRWRIERLDLVEGVHLERTGAGFVDVTDMVGLHYNVSDENERMARSFIDQHRTLALGGLSAVDWNADGFWDLIGTRRGQIATLFLNDGAGGFVPERLPMTSPREHGSFLLYVDLDGDGTQELVGSEVLSFEGARARIGLYVQYDGFWELDADAFEFDNPAGLRRLSVQTVVPLDANGDGLLDLFFAVYGNAHSRGEDYNTVEAHDGADNLLFINHGGLKFVEESDARGIHGTQYTYVAQAFDFDGDGDEDLFEGNDFGPNILWLNDGTGKFQADETLGFGGVSAYTMGVTLADWDNSGQWSLYVSNMSSEQGARLVPLADGIDEPMRNRIATIAQGNMLYRQGQPGAPWIEHAVSAHCNEAEWAWGSVFVDVDNDGDRDLYVTNGFTSHSDASLGDWQTYYWNQVIADGGFLERGERSTDVNAEHAFEGSFNGYERDRLFYAAEGDRSRFYDAASVFGVDAQHDGRCVVPVDVDGDGDLDLALWTLQGLRLLDNRAASGHFARIALLTDKGRLALGATVHVTARGVTQRDRVKIVDGFQTQVPSELHFGLGDAERIERIEVHWTSGGVSTWTDLPVDARIVLREGSDAHRAEALPSWPATARPQGVASLEPTILDRVGGGAESVTEPDHPTVARFITSVDENPPWPDFSTLRAARPEARCVVIVPEALAAQDRERIAAKLADRAPVLVAQDAFLQRAVGAAPPPQATLVLDRRGRLRRAFLRQVGAKELARVLGELADEPPFADLLIESGRLALRRGQFRDAAKFFQRAVKVDSGLARAYEGMARAHVYLGQLELAEEAYLRSIQADPDYALGHYNLGVTRNNLGRPSEAVASLQEALRISGDDLPTLRALGEAALRSDRLELADDAYRRAIRLSPEDFDLVLTRGKVLGKRKLYAEAKKVFEHALRLRPRAGEARDALRLVERLISEDPH
ncbi:MAG: tetratricopeptide repeat protein [bacterium]|nr:tetratricopeptide repeat protein [bacterium]